MCELFGVSSPVEIELNKLLIEFFSHGRENPNGWGMAFFDGDDIEMEKQPVASHKSTYLKQLLSEKIISRNMFGHIRRATKGNMDYENTHPFIMEDDSKRIWTFQHNGTIFESEILEQYAAVQEGTSDSERILLYLIDRMNEEIKIKGRPLSPDERFSILDDIVCRLSPENKLNLMIYDGELTYIHTNNEDTLFRCRKGEAAVFSTKPLDFDVWEPVQINTLIALKDGESKHIGTTHNGTFIETEEKMRFLLLDYSGL